MTSKPIGENLRKQRKRHGWTIGDVVFKLRNEYHIDIAEKTVYGWESDQAYPRTETLLLLFELYHMEDVAENMLEIPSNGEFPITAEERQLIRLYRLHPELHSAVKRLLDVPPSE